MYISNVIDKNISANKILNDRGLLSQNILSQLRNLVEDIAILINNKENNLTNDTHYDNVSPSLKYISSKSKYKYIFKFHDYLQSTASHYTPNDGDAERLLLFYFRYICMLKDTLKNEFDINILNNLKDFPIYEDNLTKEHYELISSKIEEVNLKTNKSLIQGRFYVNKVRPIYSNGKLYYEITLTKAIDYINKFERITMYSKLFIPDNYSIKLSYIEKEVEIISNKTKIKVIDNFIIFIRPCELKNIGKILNLDYRIEEGYSEYTKLMIMMTRDETTLLEELMKSDEEFNEIISEIKQSAKNNNLSNLLIQIRKYIFKEVPGINILKYLLCKLENVVIKSQIDSNPNTNLSNLCLKNKSIPFDTMPYAMSLSGYNTSWKHLVQSIDMKDREHELLARYIRFNCENNNILYTSISEVEDYGDVNILVEKYNNLLVEKRIDTSSKGKIIIEHDYLYINSYEVDSINIIKQLQNYKAPSDNELKECIDNSIYNYPIMDLTEDKVEIINKILRNESVVIIHGPAGTGKTKMLEVLAEIYGDYKKIFIANTNTAKDNLERRISDIDKANSTFQTVHNYVRNNYDSYDILIVDECSTISNKDMYSIISRNSFKLIILSGDIYQIESIKYGNWFSLSYNYFKKDFVYDLSCNNRTDDADLLELWQLVRDNDDKAISKINSQEYSKPIGEKIFERKSADEISLCLNYDGLYGINNINKIMQEKNPGEEFKIGVDTYKINDPVVFNDCPRFKLILYNNMKGTIKNIEIDDVNDYVWFTIEINEIVHNYFGIYTDIELIEYTEDNKTVVRFFVKKFKDTNEDDEDYQNIIPFNLAYAVSIHKAQGLEYESVKIIITSNIEDNITKNIFYTAITRTKKKLTIFWSPESQKKVFENFKIRTNSRDISILKTKI